MNITHAVIKLNPTTYVAVGTSQITLTYLQHVPVHLVHHQGLRMISIEESKVYRHNCTPLYILRQNLKKKNDIWWVCGMGEAHTGFWWGKVRGRDHLEDLGLNMRIILKLICGRGSSVGIGLTTGWTVRDRIPVGTKFSARQNRPWGPPSLL